MMKKLYRAAAVVGIFFGSVGLALAAAYAVGVGGTGWTNIQANTILLGNGTSRLSTTTAGTNGQVLGLVSGIPSWVSTTTLANISGTLAVISGGTGANTFVSGLIAGNGTNPLYSTATTTASCAGTVSCSAFTVLGSSPVTLTGSGGGGSGSGNVATSTSETAGQLAVYTSTGATPALIGKVATSSFAAGSEFSYSGTLGALVGGANGSLTLATNGTALSKLVQIAANSILGNNIGATGNIVAFATSTLYGTGTNGFVLSEVAGIPTWVATTTLANISGTLGIGSGGTATTTFYSGGVVYSDGSKLTQAAQNGNDAFFWDATNKRLGVGTTTPSATFSVQANNGTNLNLFTIGSSTAAFATSTLFNVDNKGRTTLAAGSAGNSTLTFSGIGNAYGFYEADTSNIGLTDSSTAGPQIAFGASSGIKFASTNGVYFTTSGTAIGTVDIGFRRYAANTLELLTGSSNAASPAPGGTLLLGQIGIGGVATTTPGGVLSVAGTAGGTLPLFLVSSSTSAFATSTVALIDSTGNAAFGLSGGKLDVGSTTGTLKAEVVDPNGNGTQLRLNYDGTNYADIGGSSAGRFNIRPSGAGNVDIYGTSPVLQLRTTSTGLVSFSHDGSNGSFQNNVGNFTISNTAAAGGLMFRTNNVQRMNIDQNGKVGIGTTTPTAQLSVSTSTASDALTRLFVVASSTNAELLTVLGGGNVGIGLSNPAASLEVKGTTTDATSNSIWWSSALTNLVQIQNNGFVGIGTSSPYAKFSLMIGNTYASQAASTAFAIGSSTAGTATSTLLTVLSSGFVGIGTSAPTNPLTVIGTTNTLRMASAVGSALGGFCFGDDTAGRSCDRGFLANSAEFQINQTLTDLRFMSTGATNRVESSAADGSAVLNLTAVTVHTSGNLLQVFNGTTATVAKMVLDFNGKLGLGTTTPGGLLSVAGAAAGSAPLFLVSSSTAGFATSTAFLIDSQGNVGVGTTSPSQVLSVNGKIYSSVGGFQFPDGTVQATAATAGYSPVGSTGQIPYFSATNTLSATSTITLSTGSLVGIASTTPTALFSINNLPMPSGITTIASTSIWSGPGTYAYTAPAGTTYVQMTIWGAGGGGGNTDGGSAGAYIASSTTFMMAGQTGTIYVGQGGRTGSPGAGGTGYKAGGTGSGNSSGGGGSSAFTASSTSAVICAAAGAGGTQNNNATTGATGATTSGGTGATNGTSAGGGGGGATVGANASGATAGVGGTGCSAYRGTNGDGSTGGVDKGGSSAGASGNGVSGNAGGLGSGGAANGANGVGYDSGGGGNAASTGQGGNPGAGGANAPGGDGKVIITAYTSASTFPGMQLSVGPLLVSETNIAIGTTTTSNATFTIQGIQGAVIRAVYGVIGVLIYRFEMIDPVGHLVTGGPAPTATCSGASAVNGDDRTGSFSFTSTGACTMNFANAWPVTPVCVASSKTTAANVRMSTISPSSVTFSFSSNITDLNYICQAHQ